MPLSFALNPFGRVYEVIGSWRPRGCKTEKDYERSLVKKLEKELVKQTITPQWASGRQRVDIVVHGKVPIEIKRGLKSTASLHTTIGQLNQYLKDWDAVILVLCGDISRDLLTELRRYIEGQNTILYQRVYLYTV
jgi:hypothetical protein